ncbi:response regulator [Paenibacillus sp. PL2-23]|uniref:response regulator n=1 Tax=Paenibacillus sp. PL2-23 TaxID=2100729 RepID=UPI0030FCC8F5
MQVLIVDDERRTREYLRDYIDWGSYGFLSVYTAEDGLHALELAKTMKPELILTDIMMPRMNGIELAQAIRETDTHCRIIILSAYTEKHLLKSAIQLQVVDYVEKPIDLDELGSVIGRAAALLQEDGQRMESIAAKQRAIGILCKASERDTRDDEVRATLKQIGFPEAGHYRVIMAASPRVPSEDGGTNGMESCLKLIQQRLKHTQEGCCSFLYHPPLLPNQPGIGIIGSTTRIDAGELEQTFIQASRECEAMGIKLAVGEEVDTLAEIPYSYMSAQSGLDHFFLIGHQRLLSMPEDRKPTGQPDLSEATIFKLVDRMVNGQSQEAEQQIADLLEQLALAGADSLPLIKGMLFKLLNLLESEIEKQQLNLVKFKEEQHEYDKYLWELLASFQHIGEVGHYLRALGSWIRDHHALNPPTDLSQEISRYIEQHLSDPNVSIGAIAGHFGLTPSYICQVFRRNTGQTIGNALTLLRMEQAKQYLASSDMHTYEVALAIGFNDAKYFTKVFKKEVGMTPSEYRKKVTGD